MFASSIVFDVISDSGGSSSVINILKGSLSEFLSYYENENENTPLKKAEFL